MSSGKEALSQGFYDFCLGDDPRGLGGGVVWEIADTLRVDIDGPMPDAERIRQLGLMLRRNLYLNGGILTSDLWTLEQAADTAARSGILEPASRTFFQQAKPLDTTKRLVGGDSASSMETAAAQLHTRGAKHEIIIVASRRELNTVLDRANPHVQEYFQRYGHWPTEAQFAGSFILPNLEARRQQKRVPFDLIRPRPADPYLAMREAFLDGQKEGGNDIWGDDIVCRMAGGYSLALACRTRLAGRSLDQRHPYDFEPALPAVYIESPGSKPAATAEQLVDPRFTNPYDTLHNIVYTTYWMTRARIHQERNPFDT
jgi:hypothetical protein